MIDTRMPPSQPPQPPKPPADKAAADKAAADKAAADKREADKRSGGPGHFDNPSQDPNHPSNKTLSKDMRPGAERDHIEGPVYTSENLRTEQEKDAENDSLGIGPLSRSEHTSGPVETIEDQGIGPRTPYPFGDPPPPSESVSYGQGIKGGTDKPSAKPGSSSGPAGTAPAVDDKDAAYKADHKDDKPKPAPGPMATQRDAPR
jgi:hypothetical protein